MDRSGDSRPHADVEVKLASGTNTTVRGLADPILDPFALQWAPKQIGHGVFVQRAILDLTVPIGKYSVRSILEIISLRSIHTMPSLMSGRASWKLVCGFIISGNSANMDPFVGFGIRICNRVRPSIPTTPPRMSY
jgi:hypothetical protein